MSKLPIAAIEAKEELEMYLKNNPQFEKMRDRIDQSMLKFNGSPLKRFEFLLELSIGHLELLSDKMHKMKKEYGIEHK